MYFEWKNFGYRPLPAIRRAPVAIVGAGPVGLAMALALARYGVRPVLIEKRDQVSDGSRSVAMTRRTLQIFDALGVARPVLDKALLWDRNSVHFGEQRIYGMTLHQPDNESFRMTNLQQCWVEQILVDELKRQHDIDVCWRNEVVGLDQDGEGVRLSVRNAHGDIEQLDADYVVAADGSRSQSRGLAGLSLEGNSFEQRFVIIDILMRSPREAGRSVWFSPPYAPGTTVIQHKGPFDIWRLDYQLRDDEDVEEELQTRRVHERVAAHLAMIGEKTPYELVWASSYRANAVNLHTYMKGRVAFAGDAAHQMPIFGGRGVNNGYLDVFNLAWRLAYVVRGLAPAALLDGYSRERQPVIAQTIKDLRKVTLYMTTPSPGLKLLRDAVLSLSLTETFVLKLFEPFSVPAYNTVPLGDGELTAPGIRDGIPAGRVAPDFRAQGDDGREVRAFQALGAGFTCLAFVCDPEDAKAVSDLFIDLKQRSGIASCVAVTGIAGLTVPAADRTLHSTDAFGLYAAASRCTYLLRPDHHVCGAWPEPDADGIAGQIAASLAQPGITRQQENAHG